MVGFKERKDLMDKLDSKRDYYLTVKKHYEQARTDYWTAVANNKIAEINFNDIQKHYEMTKEDLAIAAEEMDQFLKRYNRSVLIGCYSKK